jgi:F1F0 ATPase subunit 2
MTETLTMLLIIALGFMLGIAFFASLWWTIKQGLTSTRPIFLFLVSALFRTSLTLVGFYFISNNSLKYFLLCLLGFLIGRFMMIRIVRLPASPMEAASYASKPR